MCRVGCIFCSENFQGARISLGTFAIAVGKEMLRLKALYECLKDVFMMILTWDLQIMIFGAKSNRGKNHSESNLQNRNRIESA